MWYEKYYNKCKNLWWVYKCSSTDSVLVGSFKTEKGADNFIKKHSK